MTISRDEQSIQGVLGRPRQGTLAQSPVQKPRTQISSQKIKLLHNGFGYGAERLQSQALRAALDAASVNVPAAPQVTKREVVAADVSQVVTLPLPSVRVARKQGSDFDAGTLRLKIPDTKTQPVAVSRSAALGAFFIDFLLILCLLPIASVAIYLFAPDVLTARVARYLEWTSVLFLKENAFVVAWGILAFALWAVCLVVIQTISVVGYHASLGRAVMGIRLAGKAEFSATAGLLLILNELLTLGGLIVLPLISFFPSVVPLFPWLRLGQFGEREQAKL